MLVPSMADNIPGTEIALNALGFFGSAVRTAWGWGENGSEESYIIMLGGRARLKLCERSHAAVALFWSTRNLSIEHSALALPLQTHSEKR